MIRTGEPDLQPEIPDAMLEAVAQDAEHLEILRALGFRSSMIVPLRAGGRVVGDLALVSAESGRRFGAADLAAAQELADRCGLYLENARLYRELERARATSSRRSSPASPTPSPCRTPTAGSSTSTTPRCGCSRAARLPRPRGAARRAAGASSRRGFEMLGEDGEPFPLERLPGRLALAGEEPEPVILRYRVRGDRRVALVARQGAAAARAGRHASRRRST